MDTSTIVDLGKKYLKSKVILKAGKALITKRAGFIGLGIGAAAGVGYLAYNLINKKSNGSNSGDQGSGSQGSNEQKTTKKIDQDLTRVDNIEDNNHEVKGKKIVI